MAITIVEIIVRVVGLDAVLEGKSNSWGKAGKNLLTESEGNYKEMVRGERVENGGMENLQRSGGLRIKMILLDF